MAIKVIVELRGKPGRRDELTRVLESLIAAQGPGQHGFWARYQVAGGPGVLAGIADGESARVRETHLQDAAATGACAPLVELLAAPVQATVVSQLR